MDASKKKKPNSNRMCSVPQCSDRAVAGDVSLHVFPRDKKLRKLWAAKMRIGKKVTGEMYACSEHFRQDDYFWSHLGHTEAEVQNLLHELQKPLSADKAVQANVPHDMAQKFKLTDLLTTDSKLNTFTGIPNMTLLNKIVQLVEKDERENKLEATAKDGVLQLVQKSKSPPNVPVRRCDQCGYTSYRTANMNRHKEKLHNKLRQVEHCCNREFRTRHDFIRHREQVHLNGNYLCTVDGCAKTFVKRSLLDRHIKAHKKEYKHVCKPCDYRTVVYSNYQRHRISGRCRAQRGITLTPVAEEKKEREAVQEQPRSKREENRHSKREHEAALALLLLHDSLYERASEAVAELIDLRDSCLTECTVS
ncbi:hypothetical protein MTO96_028417 [Rhipicephalus appendiculatus]